MFGLKDISVDFLTGSPWLVALAMVVLLALSFILYRRTNPPLPGYLRLILGTIRVLAVLLLIAALFEPVISYSREYRRDRRVSVLIDRSSSMDRVEAGKSRRVRLDSLLSGPEYARLRAATDVRTYYFGGNLGRSDEGITRDRTALGEALSELEKLELGELADYWLLFSDGNSNSGRPPAQVAKGLAVPIISVGMAGAASGFDIGIAEVEVNPVVFVGQPTEVQVKLRWQGGAERTVQIQLREADSVVAADRYRITEEAGFVEIDLRYIPSEPGQKMIQVRVPPLEGEATDGNNMRTVALKVLKSRLNVLLVCEHPDYEVGFLNRYLRQADRYDVDLLVMGPKAGNLSGQFPSRQADLNRYDLVILYDPDPARLDAQRELLHSYLAERGGGLWVLLGPQYVSRGPQSWFNDLLPFYQNHRVPVQFMDFHGAPAEGQLFHPAVRLADDRAAIRELWGTLPPFQLLVPCDQTVADATILVYAAGSSVPGTQVPVMGYRRVGPGKVLASTALPFWPWGFVSLGFEGDDSNYRRAMEGIVSWLTIQDDFDPIRISPDKDVFSRGEAVRFEGYAFDQGFRPLPGVTGLVTLERSGEEEKFEADLLDRGEGRHTAEFRQLSPGEYRYRARFDKDGHVLKEKTGRILIEPFSLEEYDQSGDPAVLMALARATAGGYYPFADFPGAVASMDLGAVVEKYTGEVVVWGKLWLLLLFVGLLGLEWLLRKMNHLI